jgi:hypothetical protein
MRPLRSYLQLSTVSTVFTISAVFAILANLEITNLFCLPY